MQRPSLAACRFYQAFYRWNVLTSPAERPLPHSAYICAAGIRTIRDRSKRESRTNQEGAKTSTSKSTVARVRTFRTRSKPTIRPVSVDHEVDIPHSFKARNDARPKHFLTKSVAQQKHQHANADAQNGVKHEHESGKAVEGLITLCTRPDDGLHNDDLYTQFIEVVRIGSVPDDFIHEVLAMFRRKAQKVTVKYAKERPELLMLQGSRRGVSATRRFTQGALNDSIEERGATFRVGVKSLFQVRTGDAERVLATLVAMRRGTDAIADEGLNEPPIQTAEDAQLCEDVRAGLRPLAYPVALITSRAPSAVHGNDDLKQRSRGVTVSSFNTVALNPHPIISFNIKIPSRSWDAIAETKDVCIHLLAATPMGAEVAATFTKPHKEPHMGFQRLENIGVNVILDHRGPPRVLHKSAVIALMRAQIMRSTGVGDHLIVVARITSCQFFDGKGHERHPSQIDPEYWNAVEGLSYAKQRYRYMGKELVQHGDWHSTKREKLKQEETASPGVPRREPQATVSSLLHEGGSPPGDPSRSKSRGIPEFERSDDPIYDALRATRDEVPNPDWNKIMGFGDEMESSAKQEERSRSKRKPARTGSSPSKAEPHEPNDDSVNADAKWGKDDFALEEAIRQEYFKQAAEDDRAPDDSANLDVTSEAPASSNQTFGSTFRPANDPFETPGSRRRFSTYRVIQAKANRSRADIDNVVDPISRNVNVADFFGIPEEGRPYWPRVRSLVSMKKEARFARIKLEKDGHKMTDQEKAQLYKTISNNTRAISRKLAWNASVHLRVMLDKSRVDFKRAQFFESAIEQGQASVMEEMNLLRDTYDNGRISFDEYTASKKSLEDHLQVYQTELLRLRQFADEEGDVVQDNGPPGEVFDGFKGNR